MWFKHDRKRYYSPFGAFSTINSWADLLPLHKQIEAGIK
jgi:hypothetical protein